MLEILGARQKELLKLLLKNKSGMTADELSAQLGVTRNAVRQHLAALETDRLVEKAATRPSGGRPQQLYVLSERGQECFPRQYSWMAQLLVESVMQESGAEALGERLAAMGRRVGAQLRSQYPDLKTRREKVRKLAEIMEDIGYSAHQPGAPGAEGAPLIDADNCVFHHLAMKNPDICRFDLALMASFTDSSIVHQECMAKNDDICRFRFDPKKSG